jgi:uncharacterized membrane protein
MKKYLKIIFERLHSLPVILVFLGYSIGTVEGILNRLVPILFVMLGFMVNFFRLFSLKSKLIKNISIWALVAVHCAGGVYVLMPIMRGEPQSSLRILSYLGAILGTWLSSEYFVFVRSVD